MDSKDSILASWLRDSWLPEVHTVPFTAARKQGGRAVQIEERLKLIVQMEEKELRLAHRSYYIEPMFSSRIEDAGREILIL